MTIRLPLPLYYEGSSKSKSYRIVSYALRLGIITRPNECEICELHCDDVGTIQAHHHKGYTADQALNVRWLCAVCHIDVHMGWWELVDGKWIEGRNRAMYTTDSGTRPQ